MLYLTVVPDDFYFLWQLEIQLENFSKLGIDKNSIHVLIGFHERRGLRPDFKKLSEELKDKASFFFYPDNRSKRNYLSSIRPRLIQSHIQNNPWLQEESIFYYDSDIIFREVPDFDSMNLNATWYVSDTRTYLDSKYLIAKGSEALFYGMCDIVGIDPTVVKLNDGCGGGAQYLIKKAPLAFWEKVEKDCELLYTYIEAYNFNQAEEAYIKEGTKRSECGGVQAWCADMWAVLWNAWLFNYKTEIHPDLAFCLPIHPIQEWQRRKILHYAGVSGKEEKRYFRKANYNKYLPYYDSDLQFIDQESCSHPLVKLIKEIKKQNDSKRTDLSDLSFLIPVRIDSQSRYENLCYLTNYLDRYFKTEIIIAEADDVSKIRPEDLPESCKHYFIKDSSQALFRTKINNWMIKNARTKFIAIYDTDVILPLGQILSAVQALRNGSCEMVYPYDGSFVTVDSLYKEIFGKILDDELLVLGRNKFLMGTTRSYGGAVFLNKEIYKASGMENEHFQSWGPEDLERQKRMKNLGYKVIRINGPLFHLPHDRFSNSFYTNEDERLSYMKEYFLISKMGKTELLQYIEDWPWMKN